jgi:hypothetical protein
MFVGFISKDGQTLFTTQNIPSLQHMSYPHTFAGEFKASSKRVINTKGKALPSVMPEQSIA